MMVYELIYTSAPEGLQPGSRGFCTVAATADLPRTLMSRLESLSGYRHVYPPHDERADLNPVVYSHLRVSADGQVYHVLSRIAASGLDYTKRSNKLAHHLALAPQDLGTAGPAWLLSQAGLWRREWTKKPHLLPERHRLPDASCGADACPTWVELTGDATWARILAESVGRRDAAGVSLIFRPGMDSLGLVREALNLLPPQDRWNVTFSTYYTQLPPWVDCDWRFLLEGSPEAALARRASRGLIIDLSQPASAAGEVERDPLAPTGSAEPAAHVPAAANPPSSRPPRPASGVGFLTPVRSPSGPSPEAMVSTPDPPRRAGTLRRRLVSAGVGALVALAVAFLGFQILDWQSRRERSRFSPALPDGSPPDVRQSVPERQADTASSRDAGDGASVGSSPAPVMEQPDALGQEIRSGERYPARKAVLQSPPTPPLSGPDSAAEADRQPPPPPPKPRKPSFAELPHAAALQPPGPSSLRVAGDAASEQRITILFLDEPGQLRLTLIGDVLGGGRHFEALGPENEAEGVWSWKVQCRAGYVTSEAGRFLLRKTPTDAEPNRCGLQYRWAASCSPEHARLVNCLLRLAVSGDGDAESKPRELPLRAVPEPQKETFQFWQQEEQEQLVLALVPVSDLPKTGTVNLKLSLHGFPEPIERKLQLAPLSGKTQSAKPAVQAFLADERAHVGVRPMAELVDRESTIRVGIELLICEGDQAIEDRRFNRRTIDELPTWIGGRTKIIETKLALGDLEKKILVAQNNIQTQQQACDDQKKVVEDRQRQADGERESASGKKDGGTLSADKVKAASKVLTDHEQGLQAAKDSLAKLQAAKSIYESRKAEYEKQIAKAKEFQRILESLRLKVEASASIPRERRSGADTYEVPLVSIDFEPPPYPPPPPSAAGGAPEP